MDAKYESDLFREIAENTIVGMVVFQDGRVIWANRQMAAMVGYSADELIGTDILLESIIPEDRSSAVEALMIRMDGQAVNSHFHIRMCNRDGHMIHLEAYATPTSYGARPAEALVIRDISATIQAEKDLKKSVKEAQVLLELSPDPILVHRHGIIINANRAAATLVGAIKGSELSGRRVADLFISEKKYSFWSEVDEFMDNGVDTIPASEEQLILPDGGRGIYEALSSPVVLEGNKVAITALRDISERKLVEKERKANLQKLESMLYTTVDALSATLESRDPYTSGHQKRVANLAVYIAGEMGLTASQIDGIRIGGLLHDIGKIIVPAEILSKPGVLYDAEYSLIQLHPSKGWEILNNIGFLQPVAEMVYQHHERLNGSGYPRGLRGDQILIESRILAVADVVEAMSSHRPYRPSLGMDNAIREISSKQGDIYDAAVVAACIKVVRDSAFDFKTMEFNV